MEKTLTEHWGINPSSSQQFIAYIDKRIAAIEKAHQGYKDQAEVKGSQEMIDALHTIAAGLWDTLTELNGVKEMYIKTCKQ